MQKKLKNLLKIAFLAPHSFTFLPWPSPNWAWTFE